MTRDGIVELRRRAGEWIAVEQALFEALGRLARSPGPPAVRRVLATWCHRHAWHAELWRQRLPPLDVGDGDHGDQGGAASWWPALGDALAATGIDGAVEVLVDSVLPALDAAVADHRQAIDRRLDGPTARILDLVAADLVTERDDLLATTA